ncbi:hypothetical protein PG993_014122 [Apiospora rasikravindrae]|uniref:Uncharacterized protein n=1 Tax=Apiospora rasikravindrae TaxID=990691 RepID=A0ABR1RTA6_9PEZI
MASHDAASAPDPVGPASGPSEPWCRPYRRKKGVLCYADKRLESPDTLEDHIRHWATTPPRQRLEITGGHTRTITRWVSVTGYGGMTSTHPKVEYEKVTDFRITINLAPYLYSSDQDRRKTKYQNGVNPSPPTLTEWCQRFCADESHLKRSVIRFEMTDFNTALVRQKMVALARELLYEGHVKVEVVPEHNNNLLNVYNDTHINRGRMRGTVKVLFGVTFLWVVALPWVRAATNYFGHVVVKWPFSRMTANGREYVSMSEEELFDDWATAIREAMLHRRQVTLTEADKHPDRVTYVDRNQRLWGGDRSWGGIDD